MRGNFGLNYKIARYIGTFIVILPKSAEINASYNYGELD